MEHMVNERIMYFLEKRVMGVRVPNQTEERKAHCVCLEDEIRNARVNKETNAAAFFKCLYDMRGHVMAVGGKVFNSELFRLK